jgi:tetratricopeptide (TPR) repeat protein
MCWLVFACLQPDVRPAEAMGYLDRALAVNPTLFTALLSKACALESLGKQTEAIEAFKDAAEVSSDEAKASIQFRLGQLLFMYVTDCHSKSVAAES